MLAVFFITISHCAWRHFISLSNGDKETKQRKRLPTTGELVSLACRLGVFGTKVARCSPERRTLEPLLLANPDIPTLRHQCSRASSNRHRPTRSYASANALEKYWNTRRYAPTPAPEITTHRITSANLKQG